MGLTSHLINCNVPLISTQFIAGQNTIIIGIGEFISCAPSVKSISISPHKIIRRKNKYIHAEIIEVSIDAWNSWDIIKLKNKIKSLDLTQSKLAMALKERHLTEVQTLWCLYPKVHFIGPPFVEDNSHSLNIYPLQYLCLHNVN